MREDRITILEEIYDNHVSRRVGINVDTTEKQLLYDISATMIRVEKCLNDINMTIKKVNGINVIESIEEDLPTIPSIPEVPQAPEIPTVPEVPAVPAVPEAPVIPEPIPEPIPEAVVIPEPVVVPEPDPIPEAPIIPADAPIRDFVKEENDAMLQAEQSAPAPAEPIEAPAVEPVTEPIATVTEPEATPIEEAINNANMEVAEEISPEAPIKKRTRKSKEEILQ